jgi:hypothetical protein
VGALAVATVLVVGAFTLDARDARMSNFGPSEALRAVSGPTLERLGHDPADCGERCRYYVTATLPAMGYGMALELERHGFDARMHPGQALIVHPHRTALLSETDAEVVVATGDADIARWRGHAGARQLARDRRPGSDATAVFLVVR